VAQKQQHEEGWVCPLCKQARDSDGGHDPCIRNLPGVLFACCGHGKRDSGYVYFENGTTIYFRLRRIMDDAGRFTVIVPGR
jgi:hypothetical protein